MYMYNMVCMYIVHDVVYMSITCHTHVILMYCKCLVNVMYMSSKCHVHVMYMSGTCHVHVMSYTCHVGYMSCTDVFVFKLKCREKFVRIPFCE